MLRRQKNSQRSLTLIVILRPEGGPGVRASLEQPPFQLGPVSKHHDRQEVSVLSGRGHNPAGLHWTQMTSATEEELCLDNFPFLSQYER